MTQSNLEPPPESGWDTANLHLQGPGGEQVVPVPFRTGRATLLDLLAPARELAGHEAAATVADAKARGLEVSCRAGCGACCRQLVAISLVDAQALADLVAAMPSERQTVIRSRFAEAIRLLEEAGLLDPQAPPGQRDLLARNLGSRAAILQDTGRRYFDLHIPCPFLEDESCGIYADRPITCREYHVTSPAENCARLYQVGVDRLEVSVRLGEVLARTAHQVAGTEPWMIPLVLSLEWSEHHGAELKQGRDGLEMLKALLGQIDRDFAQPFAERKSEK